MEIPRLTVPLKQMVVGDAVAAATAGAVVVLQGGGGEKRYT